MEQIERIGITAVKYYNQVEFIPTQLDFSLWLASLNEPMRQDFKDIGVEKCKKVLSFKRFWLEMNNYDMDDFMKDNLSHEDYLFWSENTVT